MCAIVNNENFSDGDAGFWFCGPADPFNFLHARSAQKISGKV